MPPVRMNESKLQRFRAPMPSQVEFTRSDDKEGVYMCFFCFVSHFRVYCHSRYFVFFNGKLKTDGKRQHSITFKQTDTQTPQCYLLIRNVAQITTLSRSQQQLIAPVVHQQHKVVHHSKLQFLEDKIMHCICACGSNIYPCTGLMCRQTILNTTVNI